MSGGPAAWKVLYKNVGKGGAGLEDQEYEVWCSFVVVCTGSYVQPTVLPCVQVGRAEARGHGGGEGGAGRGGALSPEPVTPNPEALGPKP